MLNSRDIKLLRPDVAANCLKFLDRCLKETGYKVKVTGTVRDDEYQADCYRRGTGGKPPATFHSVKAGLAFDVCKELQDGSIDYNDTAFWDAISKVGKEMGFTWGGTWERVDKPHFQWDAHGRFTGANIRAGNYPPPMPLYKETVKMEKSLRDKVKERFGFSDQTMDFLEAYKYGDELLKKLAEGK